MDPQERRRGFASLKFTNIPVRVKTNKTNFDGCQGEIFSERERETNASYNFWKENIISL